MGLCVRGVSEGGVSEDGQRRGGTRAFGFVYVEN